MHFLGEDARVPSRVDAFERGDEQRDLAARRRVQARCGAALGNQIPESQFARGRRPRDRRVPPRGWRFGAGFGAARGALVGARTTAPRSSTGGARLPLARRLAGCCGRGACFVARPAPAAVDLTFSEW